MMLYLYCALNYVLENRNLLGNQYPPDQFDSTRYRFHNSCYECVEAIFAIFENKETNIRNLVFSSEIL